MQIKIDWSSQFKPDKLDADMLARGEKAMIQITTEIRNRARQRLQWRKGPGAGLGGRFQGQLARSLTAEVRLSHTEIEGTVRAGVPYAKYVEGWNSQNQHVPTVRHRVKFRVAPGLRLWAMRHGIKVPKDPQKGSLMVGGESATTPFLEPTFIEILPSAREILAGSVTSG